MKGRRAFLVAPGKFEMRQVDTAPAAGQAMLKMSVCGLCNWELNHWKGKIGPCPLTLGHEWAGTVVEVGEGVTSVKVGDVVTGLPSVTLEGFSDYIVEKAENLFKLAPGVNVLHAISEPLKCVITVLRGAAPEAGDFGVVVGAGPMGLWALQVLSGNTLGGLIAVDVSPERLAMAKKYGATHTVNPKTEDAVKTIGQITDGKMADFVIEGTGNPAALPSAVSFLRKTRGRLAMMSAYEEPSKEFNWNPVIGRGAIILGTHPAFSADSLDDMRRAVNLLNRGTFKMDGIITHSFPLDKIEEGFTALEKKAGGYVKGIIVP